VPETPEATFEALLAQEPAPSAEAIATLTTRRLEAVRAPVKQAGIEATRLVEGKAARRDQNGSRIELDVVGPETSRLSKVQELLRRLGVPIAR
jgi:hypothetical protein